MPPFQVIQEQPKPDMVGGFFQGFGQGMTMMEMLRRQQKELQKEKMQNQFLSIVTSDQTPQEKYRMITALPSQYKNMSLSDIPEGQQLMRGVVDSFVQEQDPLYQAKIGELKDRGTYYRNRRSAMKRTDPMFWIENYGMAADEAREKALEAAQYESGMTSRPKASDNTDPQWWMDKYGMTFEEARGHAIEAARYESGMTSRPSTRVDQLSDEYLDQMHFSEAEKMAIRRRKLSGNAQADPDLRRLGTLVSIRKGVMNPISGLPYDEDREPEEAKLTRELMDKEIKEIVTRMKGEPVAKVGSAGAGGVIQKSLENVQQEEQAAAANAQAAQQRDKQRKMAAIQQARRELSVQYGRDLTDADIPAIKERVRELIGE